MLTRREAIERSAMAMTLLGLGLRPGRLTASKAPDSSGPGFDIKQAMADYHKEGLRAWPFRIRFDPDNEQVFQVPGRPPPFQQPKITFWRPVVKAMTPGNNLAPKFAPLGDTISLNDDGFASRPTLLLAADPDQPDALAHPVDMRWVEDNYDGSGNARLSYWDLIPPPGYTALGQIWQHRDRPLTSNDLKRYWCVKNQFVRKIAGVQALWRTPFDWSHDGSLHTPAFGDGDGMPAGGDVDMLPATCIGAESTMAPYAIRTRRPMLRDVVTVDAGPPPNDPGAEAEQRYSPGVSHVVPMPCTAFSDPSYLDQLSNAPIYFVVNRPVWICKGIIVLPDGGTRTLYSKIGVEATSSQSFTQSTSWTISAETGLKVGGASAKVSTSFTDSFSLTRASSASHSSEVSTQTEIRLPKAKRVQVWQLYSEISIYRPDGSLLEQALYGRQDNRLLAF